MIELLEKELLEEMRAVDIYRRWILVPSGFHWAFQPLSHTGVPNSSGLKPPRLPCTTSGFPVSVAAMSQPKQLLKGTHRVLAIFATLFTPLAAVGQLGLEIGCQIRGWRPEQLPHSAAAYQKILTEALGKGLSW